MAKKPNLNVPVKLPDELAAEAIDPNLTVQEIPAVVVNDEPQVEAEEVISRFKEVADQLRSTVGVSMDAVHRPVAYALIQEMQELYEAQ